MTKGFVGQMVLQLAIVLLDHLMLNYMDSDCSTQRDMFLVAIVVMVAASFLLKSATVLCRASQLTRQVQQSVKLVWFIMLVWFKPPT